MKFLTHWTKLNEKTEYFDRVLYQICYEHCVNNIYSKCIVNDRAPSLPAQSPRQTVNLE